MNTTSSSSRRGHKKLPEEFTIETLFKFVRKHKTIFMIVGVAITVYLSMYVFMYFVAPE